MAHDSKTCATCLKFAAIQKASAERGAKWIGPPPERARCMGTCACTLRCALEIEHEAKDHSCIWPAGKNWKEADT